MNPHIIAVIYTSTEDKEITCIKTVVTCNRITFNLAHFENKI